MKYFILRQHPYFSDRVRLDGWQGKINPKWICRQDFHKTPVRSVLSADLGENVPFPDIMLQPFLLMSDLIMDVAKMYGEPVYGRDVVVMNSHGQDSRHYHLVLPEAMEDGHILWEESNLFTMRVNEKKEVVASLDFVESILRRGAVGITLQEIELKGRGKYYGK